LTNPNCYQLYDPDDLSVVIATRWLIDNLVPLKEVIFVCGPPKQFKSFLTLAWALHVATGKGWYGHNVTKQKVLYIIGEGQNPFMGRIKAWQAVHGVPRLAGQFKVVRKMVNLFDAASLGSALGRVEAQDFLPDLVVIDTFGRAMGTAKETTEDFNKLFANIENVLLERWPDVTVICVHHTRKADLVYRGPQVLAADCGGLIYVERLRSERAAKVTCEFFRNAEQFEPFEFTLTTADVMTDLGPQKNLAVNAKRQPTGTTKEGDKAEKDKALSELIWKSLFGFYKGPGSWTRYTDLFEATKAARGDKGLGNSTFSEALEKIIGNSGQYGGIRKNDEGLYQVIMAEGEVVAPGLDLAPPLTPHSPSLEMGSGRSGSGYSGRTPGVGSKAENQSRVEKIDEPVLGVSEPTPEEIELVDKAIEQVGIKLH
jgi:hypothetical protein